MTGDGPTLPSAVLEDVAYLSRSANRLRLLEVLDTGAHAPRELAGATDIPRSTLRRILTELEERGWAERSLDGEYDLTATGEHVAAETDRYVGALDAIDALGDAVGWLPNDELTVGLHRFSEATILGAEPNDVVGADTRLIELTQDAEEFYCLTNTAGTVGLETKMRERYTEAGMTVESVMTPAEISIYLDDPERAAQWREYVEAGGPVYRHEGPIPANVVVVDETVFVGDRHLEAVGLIECSDAAVRSWAVELFDSFKAEAERLDPSAFSSEASATGDVRG